MASRLQIAITIIFLLCTMTAFGWQAKELWDDVKPVRRKQNDKRSGIAERTR